MSGDLHPLAGIIAAFARAISGVQVRGADAPSETARRRIYFANHTSHLDFIVLWSALPAPVRARTRPVAAKDYWESGVKAYLAQTPNLPPESMDDVPYGRGPYTFHLLGHEPEEMEPQAFYQPTDRGFERTIAERIAWWDEQRKAMGDG